MKPYEHQIALAKLKRKYPHLAKDTVHTWRAKTDIELVHKEPTKSEQIRIWRNWKKMPDAMKRKSDAKSKKLYSMTNEEHHRKLMKKTAYQLGYEQTFEKLAINFKS